ncbi:MAG: hypothetical protein ACUVQ2_01350 [Dissulfurimicrobium sp.]
MEWISSFFIETFTYLDELLIVIEAARDLSRDIPVAAQMVFPTQGKMALGLDAGSCADAAVAKRASIIRTELRKGRKGHIPG